MSRKETREKKKKKKEKKKNNRKGEKAKRLKSNIRTRRLRKLKRNIKIKKPVAPLSYFPRFVKLRSMTKSPTENGNLKRRSKTSSY